eukprot:CAMPEP_0172453894 /NCGR_PEP_ID=MMETSP1065-20121228/11043_1 /TAXON_ID=265537 /ORGANISM="Amphiprora paludosa, Strain CCMP125" /LENGTH=67 /DNA_ID=CAMNT_0013206133 /DNA_START=240 /DNA_END=440 /DNA_ORIENTATION=-
MAIPPQWPNGILEAIICLQSTTFTSFMWWFGLSKPLFLDTPCNKHHYSTTKWDMEPKQAPTIQQYPW